jgi:hypothetical protein
MTSGELAAASIPSAREEIQGSENAQPQEADPISAAAPESEICEEGKIRSEGQDLENVDADP